MGTLLFLTALLLLTIYGFYMPLKYQSEIELLKPDFTGFGKVERVSYRFVFEEGDPRNFSPAYKIDPDRLKQALKKGNETFRGWALSFYDTQNNAKNSFLRLISDKPNAYKKIGTHLAEGTIKETDGMCEMECAVNGHFSHFEEEGIDFSLTFKIIERLVS